jgi:hypothetical protein
MGELLPSGARNDGLRQSNGKWDAEARAFAATDVHGRTLIPAPRGGVAERAGEKVVNRMGSERMLGEQARDQRGVGSVADVTFWWREVPVSSSNRSHEGNHE